MALQEPEAIGRTGFLDESPYIETKFQDFGRQDWESWFTEGQCHALAIAIHQATGWRIWAVGTDDSFDCDLWAGHLFIQTPEGQALDITGTLSMDEMTQRWDDYIPIPTYSFPTDPDAILDYWPEPLMGVAEAMVNYTLANAGLERA